MKLKDLVRDINNAPDPTDTQIAPEDMIISQYEAGQISYQDAYAQIMKMDPQWINELNIAHEMKKSNSQVANDTASFATAKQQGARRVH